MHTGLHEEGLPVGTPLRGRGLYGGHQGRGTFSFAFFRFSLPKDEAKPVFFASPSPWLRFTRGNLLTRILFGLVCVFVIFFLSAKNEA